MLMDGTRRLRKKKMHEKYVGKPVKGNYHNVSEHFITLIMADLIEWYPI